MFLIFYHFQSTLKDEANRRAYENLEKNKKKDMKVILVYIFAFHVKSHWFLYGNQFFCGDLGSKSSPEMLGLNAIQIPWSLSNGYIITCKTISWWSKIKFSR